MFREKPQNLRTGLFVTATVLLSLSASIASEPISPLEPPLNLDSGKVQLGKLLFHDTRLSRNNNIACSSCHSMDNAGADGLAKSPGTDGEMTFRNTPTVWNSSLNATQFWDGRARNLEQQVHMVISDPVEMGNDWEGALKRLSEDAELVAKMRPHYQDPISRATVVDALSEYMRAMITVDAPFDRYLRGDRQAVSYEAQQGYQLFKDLGCVSCHQGANVGGNLFQVSGLKLEPQLRTLEPPAAETQAADEFDYGRYRVTGREQDKHMFRVPSLRNVADTAPYFHDGRFYDLKSAIHAMAVGQLGKNIDDEQALLIESFLISLSGNLPGELR